MGLIPDEIIGEIRDRADIVAVIGRHVQLKKAGRNHKGLCPFHSEKSPSFSVNADKGFYYCFGCQKKGDVFSFVMEYEGKSFLEAAETLAAIAGVTIPKMEETPAAMRHASERADMLRVNEIAAKFFASRLDDAMAYLSSRGISRDIADRFGLGYAPSDWQALADHLAAQRISAELAEKVGLIVKRPRASGHYDRFRERIVCPVINTTNSVVGFSARRIRDNADGGGEAGAKYINSPESAVYKKSKLLFGIHLAREAFRRTGRAVLVEGNFDVISLHQAGLDETVAPLGTALTDEQAGQLRRLAGKVVLLYDGDKAGRAATLRALQTLVAQDVEVRLALLPTGEDPDSLVRKEGGDGLRARLDAAQPAVEYFVTEVWGQAARSAEGHAWALAEAAQVIKTIANPTRRDLIIGRLATAIGANEATIRQGLRRALGGQSAEIPRREKPPVAKGAPPRYELDLIALLADHPNLVNIAEQMAVDSLLTDSRLRDMYSAAREGRPLLSAAPDDAPEITTHVMAGSFAKVPDPARTLEEMVTRVKQVRARAQLRTPGAGLDADSVLEQVRAVITTRKQVD